MNTKSRKPIEWLGDSLNELSSFPLEVKTEIGFALHEAQKGRKHSSVKPLRGFHGASVLEVKSDFNTDTFRAMYTVRFKEVIYVLHVFQKKSKSGISTPKEDLDLIDKRLHSAKDHYKSNYGDQEL
ncbi:MAG: type II toxin-antitoxin system RelE/ParE family toxin [Candidatus Melainabacteria bacterium]|jgi:phage-related protein